MSNRPVSAGKAWAEHWKQLLPESGVHKYSHKHVAWCFRCAGLALPVQLTRLENALRHTQFPLKKLVLL